jgi:hypothetical protein
VCNKGSSHVLIPDHCGEVDLGGDGGHSYPHAHASADCADHFKETPGLLPGSNIESLISYGAAQLIHLGLVSSLVRVGDDKVSVVTRFDVPMVT